MRRFLGRLFDVMVSGGYCWLTRPERACGCRGEHTC